MPNGIKPAAFLAVIVGLTILYFARTVVTPLLCAFLAAFMVEPLVCRIAGKSNRPVAVAVTLAALAVGIFVVMIFIVPRALHEAARAGAAIGQNISALNATLQTWLGALPDDIKTQVAEALTAFSGKILSLGAGAIGAGIGVLGGIVSAVSQTVLFLVGFIFLMLDYPLLRPGLLNLLAALGTHTAQLEKVDAFLSESVSIFRGFFRGQLFYAAAIGALSAVGLWTIGLPYGLTIGMAVGLLSLVPYAGVAVGLLVAIAVSVYSDGRLLHLMLTGGVFGLVQFIDAVYLTPKLLGGSVGLHPLLTVVALLAFSQLFGFFGLMLAIPLAAITLAAVRRLLAE